MTTPQVREWWMEYFFVTFTGPTEKQYLPIGETTRRKALVLAKGEAQTLAHDRAHTYGRASITWYVVRRPPDQALVKMILAEERTIANLKKYVKRLKALVGT
jgi:hypothetical protein